MRIFVIITVLLISSLIVALNFKSDYLGEIQREKEPKITEYPIFGSFDELVNARDYNYSEATRVTPPGTKDNPLYHSFWFYNCAPLDLPHFDPTGRFIAVLRVHIEGRKVLPTDQGEIGIIDLQDNNKWTEIGRTTAWNWQQGNRLQWIPGSAHEIIWNDRADDGKSFVSRIYNMKTKKTRTLPRPIYVISPDGKTALTHDFERMKHGGTDYVGIKDKYDDQWAPKETGVWRMDIKTGKSNLVVSLKDIAKEVYPEKLPSDTLNGHLYVFREGWNPSGTRFLVFVKETKKDSEALTWGLSMDPKGTDIRYFYNSPSHHYWIDDETVVDWGPHTPTGSRSGARSESAVNGYHVFKDDNSGISKEMIWEATNGHDSFHPNGDWILTDTYNLNGYQYLYLYHLPTKSFVPLGKYEFRLNGEHHPKHAGIFRVDLHPRLSPNGRMVSFDSTHEGLGRQVYVMDIGHIIDNPPVQN